MTDAARYCEFVSNCLTSIRLNPETTVDSVNSLVSDVHLGFPLGCCRELSEISQYLNASYEASPTSSEATILAWLALGSKPLLACRASDFRESSGHLPMFLDHLTWTLTVPSDPIRKASAEMFESLASQKRPIDSELTVQDLAILDLMSRSSIVNMLADALREEKEPVALEAQINCLLSLSAHPPLCVSIVESGVLVCIAHLLAHKTEPMLSNKAPLPPARITSSIQRILALLWRVAECGGLPATACFISILPVLIQSLKCLHAKSASRAHREARDTLLGVLVMLTKRAAEEATEEARLWSLVERSSNIGTVHELMQIINCGEALNLMGNLCFLSAAVAEKVARAGIIPALLKSVESSNDNGSLFLLSVLIKLEIRSFKDAGGCEMLVGCLSASTNAPARAFNLLRLAAQNEEGARVLASLDVVELLIARWKKFPGFSPNMVTNYFEIIICLTVLCSASQENRRRFRRAGGVELVSTEINAMACQEIRDPDTENNLLDLLRKVVLSARKSAERFVDDCDGVFILLDLAESGQPLNPLRILSELLSNDFVADLAKNAFYLWHGRNTLLGGIRLLLRLIGKIPFQPQDPFGGSLLPIDNDSQTSNILLPIIYAILNRINFRCEEPLDLNERNTLALLKRFIDARSLEIMLRIQRRLKGEGSTGGSLEPVQDDQEWIKAQTNSFQTVMLEVLSEQQANIRKAELEHVHIIKNDIRAVLRDKEGEKLIQVARMERKSAKHAN